MFKLEGRWRACMKRQVWDHVRCTPWCRGVVHQRLYGTVLRSRHSYRQGSVLMVLKWGAAGLLDA